MNEKQEQLLELIANEINVLEYLMYSLLAKASNKNSEEDLKNLQICITQISSQQEMLLNLMGGDN